MTSAAAGISSHLSPPRPGGRGEGEEGPGGCVSRPGPLDATPARRASAALDSPSHPRRANAGVSGARGRSRGTPRRSAAARRRAMPLAEDRRAASGNADRARDRARRSARFSVRVNGRPRKTVKTLRDARALGSPGEGWTPHAGPREGRLSRPPRPLPPPATRSAPKRRATRRFSLPTSQKNAHVAQSSQSRRTRPFLPPRP